MNRNDELQKIFKEYRTDSYGGIDSEKLCIKKINDLFNQEWVSVDKACVNCSSFRFSDEYPCTKFLLSLNNGVVPVNQFSCNFFTPQPPNNKGKGE